jgi:NAD(P)-dependent dehydrogenase (short-subunit alcohol dehydrogenase family)
VNAVSPGYTDTPPWHAVEAVEKTIKTIADTIPLGRWVHRMRWPRRSCFSTSDDSSYVTGTELFVDGGFAQV